MPALTFDEQLIFDVAVALKKVKIPGFRAWSRRGGLRSQKQLSST